MKRTTKQTNEKRGFRPQQWAWVVVLLLMVFGMNTIHAQITLRGSQTNTSTSTSVTITKPTGLAVGDLMIANIVQSENSASQSLSNVTATGWTVVAGEQFGSSGNDSWWGTIMYKVATATDVAATNFTFTGDTDADDIEGGIAAFSGVAVTGGISGGPFDVAPGSINNINTDDLSATGITTTTAGAAIVMIGMIGDNRNVDSWTATNPSSLTEIFDVPFNASVDMGMGMAWALRATAGATGTGAGELSANENDPNGAMFLALRPCTANPTVTPVASILPVCFSTSAQTTTMPYSASTNSPTSYSIDWNTTANSAGLLDQDVTAHTFVGAGGIMPDIDIPANLAVGTYNGTLSIITAGGCRNSLAVSVTVLTSPTANAGSALSPICIDGTSAALGGSVGGSATGGTWSDGGIGGTFNPNATTLNATWTPPSGYSGTATLTLTTSGGSCGVATASKNQVVNAIPVATAGGSATICPGTAAIVSGASSANGTISWTENGAGSITAGGTSLTPTYTSAAGDAGNTVTLTMTVTNSPCAVATATYTVNVSPAAPAAPGTITGAASVCADQTSITYSIAPVANATSYTWTVPSGWNITAGQGSTNITATAGAAGTGAITVVASNSCGSTSPSTTIDINPVNVTNGTGYTTSSTKTDGNIIAANQTTPIRRGYVKFPLTALPSGAVVTNAVLTMQHNGTDAQGSSNNSVTALGNNDPTTTAAATLYSAINSGTSYSSAIWTYPGATSVTLNATARTDIQNRIANGYIALGLLRATTGTAVYNFFGRAAGANAPELAVTYAAPRSLTVTINPNTTNGSLTTSACDTYTWAENGQTYTSSGTYTHTVGCNTATLDLTVTPSTTNGNVTTSVCDSYTWTENSQTYTTTGIYTHVVGCNTATLDLTVTPSTTVGSLTTSVCDSYTWPANGQTYTSTGVYTHVVGCNTATLDLTVTPSTTNGNVTTSACDAYTWAANGTTYTATGIYTHVVDCNTATLDLTITPSTTVGSLTTSVCDTYTWAENGQTYTATGIYTHVVGCNTATLDLTVTPSTTAGSLTTSVCDSYTWPANGQTYTSSGVYTHVVGCNTATLDLTVTPSTTNGSLTETACISYTWAENGQTYTASGVYMHTVGCNTAILNLTVNTAPETFYADADGDGYGSGVAILSCNGQPENTSVNNTDCAPDDASKWRTGNLFIDADGDSYNNGFPALPVCYGASVPAGFVAINYGTDCDDAMAAVNSNASEVLGNGIDDNCDGVIDEVTPTSYLIEGSCNVTLQSLSHTVFAYQLTNFRNELGPVQGYRFRVTNGLNVRIYTTNESRFRLSDLPGGAAYATAYTVEVSAKTGGYFRAYGSPCTITTPAVPNGTYITDPISGSTLSNISNTIFCRMVPSASGYRFRVRNGETLVGTYNSHTNRFSLVNLGIANIQFGTTYTVDVLLKFGNDYRPDSEYGPTALITTPATPATSRIIAPTCGSTINSFWTTIFAQQVLGAQGYKFVVSNGVQTREYATPHPRFSLRNLPGFAAANTTYTIRVDVLYNSSYVEGVTTCNITTLPTASRQTEQVLDIFEVDTYPNPYAESFKLSINTSSEASVGVRVYDMLGREVESKSGNLDWMTSVEIGSQYPSGVYNVIVSQGEQTKTLRVIKR